MWVYFLMLAPALVGALAPPTARPRLTFALAIYFLALLTFMGLRYEVGPDWSGYLNIFSVVKFDSTYRSGEILFTELNRISDFLGFYVYGVTFVCTLLFLTGVFAFAVTTPQPWLALAMVLPYLGFVVGMSGIRQAAAIGVCYIVLARWERSSLALKLGALAVAAGFHNSAVLLLPLILFSNKRHLLLKIALTVVLSLVIVHAGADSDTAAGYNRRYFDRNVQSSGAFAHVLLSAFPGAIYLLLRNKFAQSGFERQVVTIGAIMAIASLPLTFVSSTGADRFALFFSYLQLWTFPCLVYIYQKDRQLLQASLAVLAIAIFAIYFIFGMMVFAYVPYKNILL